MKNELDKLQNSLRHQFYIVVALILLAGFACFLTYNLGYNKHEREVLARAKKVTNSNKPCYEFADIEIIIFGEPQ